MSTTQRCIRTKKWTVRMLIHFTGLALVTSWLLQENGVPRKAVLKFLEFHMIVAQVFLNKRDVLDRDAHAADAEEENVHLPQPGKRSQVTPVSHVSVCTCSAAHLPEMVLLKSPMHFRGQGCPGKSCVRCMKCNMFLCLKVNLTTLQHFTNTSSIGMGRFIDLHW